jgi:hypothetical protein
VKAPGLLEHFATVGWQKIQPAGSLGSLHQSGNASGTRVGCDWERSARLSHCVVRPLQDNRYRVREDWSGNHRRARTGAARIGFQIRGVRLSPAKKLLQFAVRAVNIPVRGAA